MMTWEHLHKDECGKPMLLRFLAGQCKLKPVLKVPGFSA